MEIVKNIEHNGIELYFESKPGKEIIEALKEAKFRWHNLKKCWFAKETKDRLNLANKIKNGEKLEKTINAPREKVENYLSIKVGDIFEMSWGYEQTNVDFFRVEELKGKTQVVIREVYLELESEEGISWCASNRVYNKNKFRYVEKSVHVKDNKIGIVKKVCGTKENPYINMTSFANAHLCKDDKIKTYESWGY